MFDPQKIEIDEEQILNLKQLFSDRFRDFIQTYFNDFEQKEMDLNSAVRNKNTEIVMKIAHSLKGNSLNVGASGLAQICLQLEKAGKSGEYGEIEHCYQDLQIAYPNYKAEYIRLTSLN